MTREHQHTDGRVARRERTRAAIVAAHTALLREGELKPTAKEIAARAGVSIRALWLNFKDMEALLSETTAYWLADDDTLVRGIDPGLELGDRIEVYCAQRARRLENIAPAARAAALNEPFSPALRTSRRTHLTRVSTEVEAVFAAEFDALGPARRVRLMSVIVASSWPAWSLLRDDLGLDVGQCKAIMADSIRRLLSHD